MNGVWNVLYSQGVPTNSFAPKQNNTSANRAVIDDWIRGIKYKKTTLGSGKVSKSLRSRRKTASVRQLVDRLRLAFCRAPRTTGPVVVYRGMPSKFVDQSDESFISVTKSLRIAHEYAYKKTRLFGNTAPRVVVAILVPPGTPILSFHQSSPDEEFLLPPGRLKRVARPPLVLVTEEPVDHRPYFLIWAHEMSNYMKANPKDSMFYREARIPFKPKTFEAVPTEYEMDTKWKSLTCPWG